jgi:hypothetical protein
VNSTQTTTCTPRCLEYREEGRPPHERDWTKMELLDELQRERAQRHLCMMRLARIPHFVLWFFGAH